MHPYCPKVLSHASILSETHIPCIHTVWKSYPMYLHCMKSYPMYLYCIKVISHVSILYKSHIPCSQNRIWFDIHKINAHEGVSHAHNLTPVRDRVATSFSCCSKERSRNVDDTNEMWRLVLTVANVNKVPLHILISNAEHACAFWVAIIQSLSTWTAQYTFHREDSAPNLTIVVFRMVKRDAGLGTSYFCDFRENFVRFESFWAPSSAQRRFELCESWRWWELRLIHAGYPKIIRWMCNHHSMVLHRRIMKTADFDLPGLCPLTLVAYFGFALNKKTWRVSTNTPTQEKQKKKNHDDKPQWRQEVSQR